MLASQKVQTKAMKQMAEQLTSQMAESFEKAINPTFQKMTESLEILTESVTKMSGGCGSGYPAYFFAGDERFI